MSIDRQLPVLGSTSALQDVELPSAFIESESAGMSMSQVFAIIWAHRKQTLLITATLVVLFAGVIKLLPKSYNAQASIIVNFEATDPLLGQQAFPTGLMDNYITTQIELIKSSSILIPVVQKLNLTTNKGFMAGYDNIGTSEEWAKAQLFKRLSITHQNYTQLIYIGAESRAATEAALLANTVAEVYLGQQQDRLNKPAIERATKYSEQLETLKGKVAVAQEKIAEFRQRNGLTSVSPDNNDTEVANLKDLEQKYQEAVNAARTAAITKENNRDVGRAASQSGLIQNLRNQLANMQTNMAQLRTTYGTNHPKVVELQSQINATQESIKKELTTLGTDSNSDLAVTYALASRYKVAANAQRDKVLVLRRLQDEGAKLTMELEAAQAVYRQGLDGYQRVLAAAGGQSTNLAMMNMAEVPIKSTKPNKSKLLVMAIAIAALFGIAVPFSYDFLLHRKIRCRDDIETELQLPVLAEFDSCPALLIGTVQ